jgi:hypothetical protein
LALHLWVNIAWRFQTIHWSQLQDRRVQEAISLFRSVERHLPGDATSHFRRSEI